MCSDSTTEPMLTLIGLESPKPKRLVPCTRCSCSGIYLDYAGPGVAGGIATSCKACRGKGWVERDDG